MFRFIKGTPAHVKAATAYNQLLSHFKVEMKFEPLKGGDKIKWVYLKQNPFGLDAVAFTGYNDPKEIKDLIETYIDYDKIFERELLKKLEDYNKLKKMIKGAIKTSKEFLIYDKTYENLIKFK